MQMPFDPSNIERLQAQVPELVARLERDAGRTGQDPIRLAHLEMMRTAYAHNLYGDVTPKPEDTRMLVKGIEADIRKDDVRARICAALSSGFGSGMEFAKIVTTVLVTLAADGKLAFPPEPYLLAIAVIFVGKIGAAALCAGYPETK